MGKYVIMSPFSNYIDEESKKLMDEIFMSKEMIFYNEDISFYQLLNIRKEVKIDIIYHHFRNDEEIETINYLPVPIICEDTGESYVDVVSGKSYKKIDSNKEYFGLQLLPRKVITAEDVVASLKLLKAPDIERYNAAINKLDKIVKSAYIKRRVKEDAEDHKQKELDNYIRSFKKNNGR